MAVKVLRILAPVIFILYVITGSEEVMSYVTAGLHLKAMWVSPFKSD